MARWLSIVAGVVLVACAFGCAEDGSRPAPEIAADRHGLLQDLSDTEYNHLPEDERVAVEAAAVACEHPLNGFPPGVFLADDIRAFYKHPVSAVMPGGELHNMDFFSAEDEDPCGWMHSAMLAHGVLKCVATNLHQASPFKVSPCRSPV
ncbi:MAG: hypothetical protein HY905_27570 [Deltaproteobacteria bacterium]|nr:hypothetical protein [Deltaproteobacteria bacterium]